MRVMAHAELLVTYTWSWALLQLTIQLTNLTNPYLTILVVSKLDLLVRQHLPTIRSLQPLELSRFIKFQDRIFFIRV